jgi:hypothetical protein
MSQSSILQLQLLCKRVTVLTNCDRLPTQRPDYWIASLMDSAHLGPLVWESINNLRWGVEWTATISLQQFIPSVNVSQAKINNLKRVCAFRLCISSWKNSNQWHPIILSQYWNREKRKHSVPWHYFLSREECFPVLDPDVQCHSAERNRIQYPVWSSTQGYTLHNWLTEHSMGR